MSNVDLRKEQCITARKSGSCSWPMINVQNIIVFQTYSASRNFFQISENWVYNNNFQNSITCSHAWVFSTTLTLLSPSADETDVGPWSTVYQQRQFDGLSTRTGRERVGGNKLASNDQRFFSGWGETFLFPSFFISSSITKHGYREQR